VVNIRYGPRLVRHYSLVRGEDTKGPVQYGKWNGMQTNHKFFRTDAHEIGEMKHEGKCPRGLPKEQFILIKG